jgi:5'-3' exonuclease
VVRLRNVEADVTIAKDCGPNDIVMTTDSDTLVYGSINTVWKLESRRKVLAYDINDVCATLKLQTRTHLTAISVVSNNDYQANVPGFGVATDLRMIREIDFQVSVATVRWIYICLYCGLAGHIARECPSKRPLQVAAVTFDEDLGNETA